MIQLLRECPPGFGVVERTAHELATQDQSTDSEVFCIANKLLEPDPLQVSYRRFFLPHLKLGRVRFLLPGFLFWRLLFSSKAVHAHLPSPEVLYLVVIMKIIQPNRCISIHWHAFLLWKKGHPFFKKSDRKEVQQDLLRRYKTKKHL